MAPISAELAAERTRLAAERTLMAWLRTSASLITFGFTLFKAFEYLADHARPHAPRSHVLTPRAFAVALIGTGLVALLLAGIQYTRRVRETTPAAESSPGVPLVVAVTAVFIALGALALCEIVLR